MELVVHFWQEISVYGIALTCGAGPYSYYAIFYFTEYMSVSNKIYTLFSHSKFPAKTCDVTLYEFTCMWIFCKGIFFHIEMLSSDRIFCILLYLFLNFYVDSFQHSNALWASIALIYMYILFSFTLCK